MISCNNHNSVVDPHYFFFSKKIIPLVPSIHPGFGIGTEAANHTKEFAEQAATMKAHHCAIRAAICLSRTAANVFLDDKLYENAVADFKNGKHH